MNLRKRRKQFWWTWRFDKRHSPSRFYGYFDWSVGHIKHQLKDTAK